MYTKLLVVFFYSGFVFASSQRTIPPFLRECYENSTFRGPQLPMNLQIIIDIIRRAEKYSETSMDVRTMSASLLHRFKFDGIENYSDMRVKDGVLPFGGTGSQRSKHRIIEELVPGNPLAFPSEALEIYERCALHRAISNTIWEHSEANSDKLCIEGVTEKLSDRSLPHEAKMCPLEYGTVLTPFGTIAIGAVISAIAASLQPQNVTVKLLLETTNLEPPALNKGNDDFNYNEDEVDLVMPKNQMALDRSMWLKMIMKSTTHIDNIWVSTVAGDLAEMAVYQGPIEGKNMILGATGYWNSTMRPNIFYIVGRDGTFDATRAEIIGGIDGLIIAKSLPKWMERFENLRLSQIMEMYYSKDGLSFDGSSRACERGKAFWNVAPITVMEEQTYATSQILAYRNSVAYMDENVMRNMVKYAVEKFNSYTTNNMFTEQHCDNNNNNNNNNPRIEAIVIFDGAWSQHYTADFLSVMADDFDVSVFGSKMGLIHGSTGDWLLNVTDSPARLHYTLSNMNNYTWPAGINFEKVFARLSTYLDEVWRNKQEARIIGNLGQVVIFIAPRVRFDATNQQIILQFIERIRSKHPEVHFLWYVSESNAKLFRPFLITEEDHLIENSRMNDVTDALLTVTRVLRPAECNSSADEASSKYQIEDYVSPRKSMLYRLHSHWRKNTKNVTVTIHNVDYGTIEICSWNQRRNHVTKNDFYCRHLSGHDETSLVDIADCNDRTICNSTYYEIRGISSKKQCLEIDCRTPQYVRYIIRMDKLSCSKGTIFSSIFTNYFTTLAFVFFLS